MALSANTRKLLNTQNMVLYVDLQFRDDGKRLDNFLAEIHETTAEAAQRWYPLLPTGTNQIFHSYGKRLCELQATLAFLDVLFGEPYKTNYRASVESRILQCKDLHTRSYTLCIQVYNQGELADTREPKSWLAQFITSDTPEMVSETGTPKGQLIDAMHQAQHAHKQGTNLERE